MTPDPNKPLIEQVCAVPVRTRDGHIEFCLVAPYGDSRWEFPQQAIDQPGSVDVAALLSAAKQAGLIPQPDAAEPLDAFRCERNSTAEFTRAFLMQVAGEDPELSEGQTYRRKWCRAEEARIRIRRKPLRRLVDIALRRLLVKASRDGSVAASHSSDGTTT